MPKASRRVMKGGRAPKWGGWNTQAAINRFKTADVRRRMERREMVEAASKRGE